MQKLKLAMSIVVGEELNSWQSPNVLRRLHNYSKLMYGHTYKPVSKYLKLTVYLIVLCGFFFSPFSCPIRTKNKMVKRSSYYASKLFSAISSFTSTVALLLWPANLYWLSRIMTNERWPTIDPRIINVIYLLQNEVRTKHTHSSARWRRRVKKIFVYKMIEVSKYSDMPIRPSHKVMR